MLVTANTNVRGGVFFTLPGIGLSMKLNTESHQLLKLYFNLLKNRQITEKLEKGSYWKA